MKSAIRHLFIFSVLVLFCAFNTSDNLLITESSIGQISVCQSFDTIDLPFLGDTSSGSDGMFFTGKFYGTQKAEILVDIPYPKPSHQKIISRLVTTSSSFKTEVNISVGTTLKELVKQRPELLLAFVASGYDDISLEEPYKYSRIEYRLDTQTELELWKLPFGGRIMNFLEIEGAKELVERLGDDAVIREIAVVRTGSCEK